MSEQKTALTIAGLDPSGGAGIIADIKTFSALDCFACAAITSITFQNTQGVFGAEHTSGENLKRQLDPILDDYRIDALKTGMLPTRETIEIAAEIISDEGLKNVVVDPVVRSTSGYDLIDDEALESLIKYMFPLSDLITPNIPEAERIAKIKINDADSIKRAAKIMREMGAKNVLIKGGHVDNWDFGTRSADSNKNTDSNAADAKRSAKDFLFFGDDLEIFEAEYIETNSTHGTGCALAAAVAANLAHGKKLNEAVSAAKDFVHKAIKNSPNIGKGHSPIGIKFL